MAPDADAPGPVRPGEELDPVRLGEYLRRTLGLDGPLHVEQFPGGHSNLTYGLFKTAVVAQQIYYRFRQGLTRDPRFAALGGAVRVLARQAAHHLGRPEL